MRKKPKNMNKLIGSLLAGLFCLVQPGVQAQVSDHASFIERHSIGVESAAVKASRDFWQRVGDQKSETMVQSRGRL